jgi:hypothetical protein
MTFLIPKYLCSISSSRKLQDITDKSMSF